MEVDSSRSPNSKETEKVSVEVHSVQHDITSEPSAIVKSSFSPFLAIMFFVTTSVITLILNLVILYSFPFPTVLFSLQLFISTSVLFLLKQVDILSVDLPPRKQIILFFGIFLLFLSNLYTQHKALVDSNFGTLLVYETCATLIVAYGDSRLLGKEFPSMRVILLLLLITVGAIIFDSYNSELVVNSFIWLALYLTTRSVSVLYTKYVVDRVPMTTLSRSFYNNTFALPFMFFISIASGELIISTEMIQRNQFPPSTYLMIMLSCFIAFGVNYSGFLCREALSATSFAVTENFSQIIAVVINTRLWDNPTHVNGLLGLVLSAACCLFYSNYTWF
eukprot:TRINITY_DN14079_c0_g1_i1.p1 TRINITY_DN14079_c0_g1~~TRINITY_DN14079_c0_g1_i1.p1  ORF type:complete len:334 (+),score=28.95 TRINITY_DN14079_c0_g1_i1:43-1044(+)